jgi:iron complex outermembrane receptor protein
MTVVRRGASALALVLPLAVPPGARAEDPPATHGTEAAAQPVVLPEQVVRLPGTRATDATGAVTVVDARRFAGEARAVAELLATSPGVSVREQGGPGQLATVSIRGANADGVKVLVDGLPLNTAAGGGVDLSRIPRHWASSLEILRGAEGARFGAGALGGVVNLVTRPAGDPGGSALLGGGSFGTYTLGVDGGAGGDGWGALAALSLDQSGGGFPYAYDALPSAPGGTITRERSHDATRSGGLLAKGFLRAGEGRWDALVTVSGGEREIPGDPYSDAAAVHDRERDGRVAAVLRHARPGPLGALLSTTLSLRADALDLDAAASTTRQRGQGGSLEVVATATVGPVGLDLGASGGGERLRAGGLGGPRARAEGSLWTSVDVRALSGRLLFTPAVRAEAVGPVLGLSSKLGAALALGGPFSVRASAGRTFRAPSFAELYLEQALLRPNPDLRREVGTGADLALVAQGGLGLASLGAFATRYDDLVVYVPVSFGAFGPVNDDRALVRGLELEAASAPLGPYHVQARLAATLQDARTLRGGPDEVGKSLPRRPGRRVFARLGAERGPLAAHLELQHLGRQWLDALEVTSVAPSTTVGAGLSLRVVPRPELRLHLEVRNLADVRTLQDGFGNPLPGRSVMLTARLGGE